MTSNLRSADLGPTGRGPHWLVPAALIVAPALFVGFGVSSMDHAEGLAVVAVDPPAAATAVVARATDQLVVDWDQLPVEPDPSPLSVAAYGD